MELNTAIEILDYHQEWRQGKREDMIHEPKKLTKALDIVLSEIKKLNIHSVIMRSEQLGCACKNQPRSIFGYTWKTCKACGKTSLMPN